MPKISISSSSVASTNSILLERDKQGRLIIPSMDLYLTKESPMVLMFDGHIVGHLVLNEGEMTVEINCDVVIQALPNNKKIKIKSSGKVELQGNIDVDVLSIDAPIFKLQKCKLQANKTIFKGIGQFENSQIKSVSLGFKGEIEAKDSRIICHEFLQKKAKLSLQASKLKTDTLLVSDDSTIKFDKGMAKNKFNVKKLINKGQLKFDGATVVVDEMMNHRLCHLVNSEIKCNKGLQDSKEASWEMEGENKITAKEIDLQSKSELKNCIIKADSFWEFGERSYINTQVNSQFYFTGSDSSANLEQTTLEAGVAVFNGKVKEHASKQQSKDLLSFKSLTVDDGVVASEGAQLHGEFNMQDSATEFNTAHLQGKQTFQKSALIANSIVHSKDSKLQAENSLLQAANMTVAGNIQATEDSVVSADQFVALLPSQVTLSESDLLVKDALINNGELKSTNNNDKRRHAIAAGTLLSEGQLATKQVTVQVQQDLMLNPKAYTNLQETQLRTGDAVLAGVTGLTKVQTQASNATLSAPLLVEDSRLSATFDIHLDSQSTVVGTNLQLSAANIVNSADIKVDNLQAESDWFLNNGNIETKKIFDVKANRGFINAYGAIQSPLVAITSAGFVANIGGDICGSDSLTYKTLVDVNLLGSHRSWNYSSASLLSLNSGLISPATMPSSVASMISWDRGLSLAKTALTCALPRYATGINFAYNTGNFLRTQGKKAWNQYQHYVKSGSNLSEQFAKASAADMVAFTVDAARVAISAANFANQFDLGNLTKTTDTDFDLATAAGQFAKSSAQLFMPTATNDSLLDCNMGLYSGGNTSDSHLGTANFGAKTGAFSYVNLSRHQCNDGVLGSAFGPTILQGHSYSGSGDIAAPNNLNMQFKSIHRGEGSHLSAHHAMIVADDYENLGKTNIQHGTIATTTHTEKFGADNHLEGVEINSHKFTTEQGSHHDLKNTNIKAQSAKLEGQAKTDAVQVTAEDCDQSWQLTESKDTVFAAKNLVNNSQANFNGTLAYVAEAQYRETEKASMLQDAQKGGTLVRQGKEGDLHGKVDADYLSERFESVNDVKDLIQGVGAHKDVVVHKGLSVAVKEDLVFKESLKRQCDLNLEANSIHMGDLKTKSNVHLKATVGDVQINGKVQAKNVDVEAKTYFVNRGNVEAEEAVHLEAEKTIYNRGGRIHAKKVTGRAAEIVNAIEEEVNDDLSFRDEMIKLYDGDLTQEDLELNSETSCPKDEMQANAVPAQHSGEITGQEVLLDATAGSMVNKGGVVGGTQYTQIQAANNVVNRAHHERVDTKFGVKDTYAAGTFVSGTGEGHDKIGLYVKAGNEIQVDSSNIAGKGNGHNVLEAHSKIVFTSHTGTTVNEEYKSNGFSHHSSSETKTNVYGNQLVSETGENFLIVTNGGISATTTNFKSAGGTHMDAKDDVILDAMKYRDSMIKSKSNLFGSHEVSLSQENVAGCVIDDNGKSSIISREGKIIGRDVSMCGNGDFDAIAKKSIKLSNSNLTTEINESSHSIGLRIGNLNTCDFNPHSASWLLKLDPLTAQASAVINADAPLTRVTEVVTLANQLPSETIPLWSAKPLSQASLSRYGLADAHGFNPKVGLQFSKTESQAHIEQKGSSSMQRHHVTLKAGESVELENYDAEVKGNMEVTAKRFVQDGKECHNTQSVTTTTIGVSMQGSATPSFDYSGSRMHSDSHVYNNQQLKVGGNLKVNVETWVQNGANTQANSLSGHADKMEITTHQDVHHRKVDQASVDSSGNVSSSNSKTDAVITNAVSGIHTVEGLNSNPDHQFTLGHTKLVGARITSDSAGILKTDTLSTETLHDSEKTRGSSFSTNLVSLDNTISNLGTDNPAYTPVKIGVEHKTILSNHQSVITPTVETGFQSGQYATTLQDEITVTKHREFKGATIVPIVNPAAYREHRQEFQTKSEIEVISKKSDNAFDIDKSDEDFDVSSNGVKNDETEVKIEENQQMVVKKLGQFGFFSGENCEKPSVDDVMPDDFYEAYINSAGRKITPEPAVYRAQLKDILPDEAIVKESVFRGSYKDPQAAFKEGFKARGIHACLVEHVYGPSGNSMYISTAITIDAATNFPQHPNAETTYVYKINPPDNGVDIAKELLPHVEAGKAGVHDVEDFKVLMDAEKEIAIPLRIPPEEIEGAWTVKITPPNEIEDDYRVNEDWIRERSKTFTPNPNHRPKINMEKFPELASIARMPVSVPTVRALQMVGLIAGGYGVYHAGEEVHQSQQPWHELKRQGALLLVGLKAGAMGGVRAAVPCGRASLVVAPTLAPYTTPVCIAVASAAAGLAATNATAAVTSTPFSTSTMQTVQMVGLFGTGYAPEHAGRRSLGAGVAAVATSAVEMANQKLTELYFKHQ